MMFHFNKMKFISIHILLQIFYMAVLSSGTPTSSRPDLRKLQMVDLSYGYDDNTIEYPGGQKFRWTGKRSGTLGEANYLAYDFTTSEHCGTHIDAPKHFFADGFSVDEIPLVKLFGTGVLIDAKSETGYNSSYVLPVDKLTEWETQHGEIPENSVIFVNFGWGEKFYPDRKLYLGPSDDQLKYPTLSLEAAKWLTDNEKVSGIGIDTPSPERQNFGLIHVMFAKKNKFILENVNLTAKLPVKFRIVTLPIKLIGGTGGPTRVVAIFESN